MTMLNMTNAKYYAYGSVAYYDGNAISVWQKAEDDPDLSIHPLEPSSAVKPTADFLFPKISQKRKEAPT